MSETTIELTIREIHGIRAALLEAVTDEMFDTEPDLLALSGRLLSELSADTSGAGNDSTIRKVLRLDHAALEAVDRSLAHARASIEGWELPIRVGITTDKLEELGARISALRRDSQ